ncbi:hypothetical protein ABKN59_007328 [Abortiporus biennis]
MGYFFVQRSVGYALMERLSPCSKYFAFHNIFMGPDIHIDSASPAGFTTPSGFLSRIFEAKRSRIKGFSTKRSVTR